MERHYTHACAACGVPIALLKGRLDNVFPSTQWVDQHNNVAATNDPPWTLTRRIEPRYHSHAPAEL